MHRGGILDSERRGRRKYLASLRSAQDLQIGLNGSHEASHLLSLRRPCCFPHLPATSTFIALTPLGSATLHEARKGKGENDPPRRHWLLHHPRHGPRPRLLKILPSREHPVFLRRPREHGREKNVREGSVTGTGGPAGAFVAILIHPRLRAGKPIFDWILELLVVSRGSIPRCVGDFILDGGRLVV